MYIISKMKFYWSICINVIFIGSLTAQELHVLPIQKVEKFGNSVVFTCSLGPGLRGVDANLKWYTEDNREIDRTVGRVYIEKDDLETIKLYIGNIKETDAGTYVCKGVVEGNPIEKSVQLTLFKGITFDEAPVSQHPVEGEPGLIICKVSGRPSPTVTWRFRGQKLHTGKRYIIDSDYGLRITNVSEAEDNGEYECRAEVAMEGRVKNVKIHVQVHKKPKIIQELGIKEGVEHQEVAIECKASGLPAPQYEFYRINEDTDSESPVSSDDRRFVDVHAGVIHFRPLNRGDNATYICRAINAAGEVDSRGQLNVIIPPKIFEYRNVTQEETRDITLTCKSEGNPSPHMTFRKVGNDYDYLVGSNDDGHVEVIDVKSGELQLTVKDLKPEDSSNYTCNSKNKGGFAEQNGTITVEFSPRFVEGQETGFFGWSGRTRNLTCQTIAEPVPVIEWYHFGKIIETNETYRVVNLVKNSVLQITPPAAENLWVYEPYFCIARNQYGENKLEMTFTRAVEPNRPQMVEVVEETPTLIKLQVTPPDYDGGVPVIQYRVDFEKVSNSYTIDEPIVLENLSPSTKYVINVRAQNEVGVSIPFQLNHETKSISKPYKIDLISHPVGLYPYEYTLKWAKPQTGGNSIKEYKFRIRQVEAVESAKGYQLTKPVTDWTVRIATDEDMDRPMMSFKLSALKPNGYYQVEVQAKNDIDWSDPSESFIFKTLQESSRPVYAEAASDKMVPSILCTTVLSLLLVLVTI